MEMMRISRGSSVSGSGLLNLVWYSLLFNIHIYICICIYIYRIYIYNHTIILPHISDQIKETRLRRAELMGPKGENHRVF